MVHAGPYSEIVTSYMKLSNPTDKRVGYKVKTNAPRQYTVEPNNGMLEPNQQQVLSSKYHIKHTMKLIHQFVFLKMALRSTKYAMHACSIVLN